MPPSIPEIQPPLIAAFFTSIQLLHEQADLEVSTLDELRKKGADQIQGKIEQHWNLQATLGGEGDSDKPVLLIEVLLSVKVSNQTSGVHLGSYKSRSRAVFEVIGMLGKINSEQIPPKAIEPYLAFAADRVRTRCHNLFGAMNLPVRIPSPRDFTTVPAATTTDSVAEKPAGRKKRKKRN